MTTIRSLGLRSLLLAGVLMLGSLGPVQAQQAGTPEAALPDAAILAAADDLPIWQRTLYKTLTYQAAANAADVLVFDMLVGASAATTTGFFIANAATAAAAYYGFEYAWQTWGPTLEETTQETIVEKTILYRFIGVGRNATLGYLYGGSALTAGAFASLNVVYDTSIFLTNEYVWDVLGPQQATQADDRLSVRFNPRCNPSCTLYRSASRNPCDLKKHLNFHC
ncbi:DUF2061 domain-containing protein [Thalassobaculum sp. OXR-137]|nr:DUF2061 domain-containing protein [Thalassobaculum sp. OXR-137]WPZ33636.1 DUF2061 domain-containing protein [Thalassobaculum sp. OXR-137]